MRSSGETIAQRVLAMAGRRSPWGGDNQQSPEGDSGGRGESDASAGSGDPEPGETPPGPRNPWLPHGDKPQRRSAGFEDLFRPREGGRKSGGGGGFPQMPSPPGGRSWTSLILGGLLLIWLYVGTVHMVGPKEQGIVTTFGSYSRTINPGVSLTFPWPIQSVDVTDVTSIRNDKIPDSEEEKLMLTSDQNLVDLSYQVRWNIKNLELFRFRLNDPETTVREVAEAAMRASVAEVPLNDVIGGTGRGKIEQDVRRRMQGILDAYRSGVLINGVQLKKTDPPTKVVDSFQKVNIAQQDADKFQNQARAWAGQVLAIAQGEAAEFDKVYGQYKLAPEVTKRRMYYETMEHVLRNNDKVVVEANGVTPYLPLPQVRAKPAPSETQVVGGQ